MTRKIVSYYHHTRKKALLLVKRDFLSISGHIYRLISKRWWWGDVIGGADRIFHRHACTTAQCCIHRNEEPEYNMLNHCSVDYKKCCGYYEHSPIDAEIIEWGSSRFQLIYSSLLANTQLRKAPRNLTCTVLQRKPLSLIQMH